MGELPKVVFLGSGEIGLPCLELLLKSAIVRLVGVVTQPDRPSGRGRGASFGEVKKLATASGVPVLQPPKIRDPEALTQLAAFEPDILIVVAYGQILPAALLDLPKLAAINLHASVLPRHRGASCIPAAILAGDRETGITVMYLAQELDAGDILLAKSIPIGPEDTSRSLHERLTILAAEALEEVLPLLIAGTAPREPQDGTLSTYAPKLSRENGRIDWNSAADQILAQIRAYDPWPGSFTTVPSASGPVRTLKIWKAHSGTSAPVGVTPGEVISTGEEGICICCGDSSLVLEEVQLEGRKRMSVSDLVRGFSLEPGIRMG